MWNTNGENNTLKGTPTWTVNHSLNSTYSGSINRHISEYIQGEGTKWNERFMIAIVYDNLKENILLTEK
jgi:hypothetical protein